MGELLGAVAEPGPGKAPIHLDGPCGIALACDSTGPQEPDHPQLAIDLATSVCACMDGRLDDRERLARSIPGARFPAVLAGSDAQLVLAAYLAWGHGFAAHLLGDFALVVWDRRQARLLCVRDAVGIRPFYYALTTDWFVFGSNLRSVLLHPAVPRGMNPGMLGEYLAFSLCSQEETLYAAVRRLPPAHLIRVDRGHLSLERYWDLDPQRRIRYRDPREYTAQFSELFGRAVVDRLRGVGTPGVTLSGGLDSSAVAGVAQQWLDAQGAGKRLRAYSVTYPGQGCDESSYIDAVVERWDLVSRRFPWTDFTSCPWAAQARAYLDLPEYPFTTATESLYAGARADGVRVLLTGEGGDFWQAGSNMPHRHLLAELRLRDLLRELRYEAGYTGPGNALRLLAASVLWGFVPGRLRRAIESRRRITVLPPFLSPTFVRASGLEQRLHCGDCAERFADASQWQIAKRARSGILVHFYEMIERGAARHGLELRHPLLDRRLIEFALAVPDHARRHAGIDRALMRDAMQDIYPAAVRGRLSAATFGIVLARVLRLPAVRQVLESAQLSARPWIAPKPYRAFLAATLADAAAGAGGAPRPMYLLWMLFALECWYRQAFEEGP